MQHRAGVTLLEVLTAMFIMAIGMLALLTLFPLGALNMAQALKDDRAASAAHNAGNFAAALPDGNGTTMSLRQDGNVTPWYTQSPYPPNAPLASLMPTYKGPGYAVLVDAYGTGQGLGAIQDVNGNPIIQRTSPTWVVNPPASGSGSVQDQWFCLLDDITFTSNATPDLSAGPVARAGKFTWSYLLQPVSATDTRTVKMSVLVYWGRDIGALSLEPPATCSGGSGNTSITLTSVPSELPRRGGWILDTTPIPTSPPPPNGVPQGYFYQVINVDPSGTVLDVQPALKADMTSLVIFNDVYFVADKGTSTHP